jgi:hypothetical protein
VISRVGMKNQNTRKRETSNDTNTRATRSTTMNLILTVEYGNE